MLIVQVMMTKALHRYLVMMMTVKHLQKQVNRCCQQPDIKKAGGGEGLGGEGLRDSIEPPE